jgi:hypothetical protein
MCSCFFANNPVIALSMILWIKRFPATILRNRNANVENNNAMNNDAKNNNAANLPLTLEHVLMMQAQILQTM